MLFFSFGLAIRDQVPEWQSPPEFNTVRCRHLIIEDDAGGPAVDINSVRHGSNAGSGVITVYAESPQIGNTKARAVRLFVTRKRGDVAERYGAVETFGPLGSKATQLISDQTGGVVHTFDPNGKRKQLVLRLRPTPGAGQRGTSPPGEEDPRKATPRPPTPDDDAQPPAAEDAAAWRNEADELVG